MVHIADSHNLIKNVINMQISSRSIKETALMYNLLRAMLELCVGKGRGGGPGLPTISVTPRF